MKIIVRKSDQYVMAVNSRPVDPEQYSPSLYDVHDIPGWDFSMADLSGVDMTAPDWSSHLKWNGTTVVGD